MSPTTVATPAGESYGFGPDLPATFPSQVLMDITEVCNLACTHCPHPDFKASEHYGGRFLDPALNSKMVEEVRRHGAGLTQYIRYASNGEPLAHPRAYEMIEEAVRHSGVYVTLTTNGTIMDERRTTRLLDAGVHMIDISIDAHRPDTYARIRRNGRLEVTRANVLRLIGWVREARAATRVVVSYVEQADNAAETADFDQYWRDAGADSVVIRRQHSCSGAKIELADLRRAATRAVARRPCLYPWERIAVNARGDLAFCPSDWVHGSVIADYSTATIHDIWSGPFYERLRAAHLANRFDGHGFCGQCPDWEGTRWPGQGSRYADLVATFIKDGKAR
jgi:sulfatase maturation enzyme AslB (radical SAM superfamily)